VYSILHGMVMCCVVCCGLCVVCCVLCVVGCGLWVMCCVVVDVIVPHGQHHHITVVQQGWCHCGLCMVWFVVVCGCVVCCVLCVVHYRYVLYGCHGSPWPTSSSHLTDSTHYSRDKERDTRDTRARDTHNTQPTTHNTTHNHSMQNTVHNTQYTTMHYHTPHHTQHNTPGLLHRCHMMMVMMMAWGTMTCTTTPHSTLHPPSHTTQNTT